MCACTCVLRASDLRVKRKLYTFFDLPRRKGFGRDGLY